MLDIYKIVIIAFLITDQANQVKFFEKLLLMTNINRKIVFKMFFPTLSSANINFLN